MISVALYKSEQIAVKIYGKTFHELLDKVKRIPNGVYDPDTYTWFFPRSRIDDLIQRVGVAEVGFIDSYEVIKNGYQNDFIVQDPIEPLKDKYKDMTITVPNYQRVGAGFLIDKRRAILADCVGTGKTIQSGFAVKYGLLHNKLHKVLIVCPNTIKFQWRSELQEKFNLQDVIVIDGTPAKRAKQWEEASDKRIVVINYESLIIDSDLESAKAWGPDVLIVDEAHYIKNPETKRTQAVSSFETDYLWMLTGTPMENRPEEIFTLMSLINPDVFGNETKFQKDHMLYDYNKALRAPVFVGYKDLHGIHVKLKPYMIRRRLEDIPDEDLSSLPEVMPPMNVEVELTKDQVKAYRYIQDHEQEIKEQVRKILKIDPDSKEKEDKDKIQLGYNQIKVGLSHSCEILMKSQSQMARRIIKDCDIHNIDSPKIDRAVELSKDIIGTGSKIVIFTELRSVQNIMHEKLNELGIEHVVVNKDVKAEDRETLKTKFRTDKNCKIFLTTDASKEGANLQAANYLINLDLPWKPSTYEQRMGRIRRMGSAFARCFIINMISVAPKGEFETIDQIRMRTIINKQDLIDKVVEGK